MRLRKIIKAASAASLGVSGLILLGGYAWLYGWKWGSAPAANSSMQAEEVRLLQEFDTCLVSQAVQDNRAELRQTWALDEGLEVEDLTWVGELSLCLAADWLSKATYAPARESLHAFLSTGKAQENMTYLAFLALNKQDVPLFKLFVEKSLAAGSPHEREHLLFRIPGQESMPVAQRLELLDWMLSKGVMLTNRMSPYRFREVMAHSMSYTDDERGEILDWFLRHGYELDGIEAADLLLRQKQSVLPTWQKLVADGVLPPPPMELSPRHPCTAMQLAAGNEHGAPEMVRWLLALGHGVHAEAPAVKGDWLQPLDACAQRIQYLSMGVSGEQDALLLRHLEVLEILLEHGAVPTELTREMLPFDAAVRQQFVELMQKHGHHITAGDNPYNACCVPE